MKFKLIYFVLLVLLLSACSSKEQANHEVPNEEPKQVVEEKEEIKEEIKELEKDEVQEILQTNLDNIFDTYDRLGSEYGWGVGADSDFSKIRPELLPFATESFTDSNLKEIAAEYYCECDLPFKPFFHRDVRFTFVQKGANIKIAALDPATELSNMGRVWEFELVQEDNSWKMNGWSAEPLDVQDLQLTKEEAGLLLTSESETPEFVEEYDSTEALGKAYVFKMDGEYGERIVGISSTNTQLVYDFEQEEPVEEEPEVAVQEETIESTPEPVVEEEVRVTAGTKVEYLARLDEVESQEQYRPYLSDAQLREDAGHNYQLWDGVLNEIYGVLKTQLSESEFIALRDEQREWIKTRDAAAQARYDEEGGGTLSMLVEVETLFSLTKERCYELVNGYME